MSARANAPIIIKRKKVVGGGGHHGGAWKVAYADFVTAMMAFFLLMWLLNATTEQQRKGLSDYFAPSVPLSRTSGGGDGMFGGQDVLSDDAIGVIVAERQNPSRAEEGESPAGPGDGERVAETESLREIEEMLLGQGGESLLSETALRHIVTRVTDEGLVIEIFALPDAPLFQERSDVPMPVTVELLKVIARVSNIVPNPIAIGAHVPAQPIVLADSPVWDVTTDRTNIARRVMETAGLDPQRVHRMTGHGDRSPAVADALAVRNDRLEVTILRTMP